MWIIVPLDYWQTLLNIPFKHQQTNMRSHLKTAHKHKQARLPLPWRSWLRLSFCLSVRRRSDGGRCQSPPSSCPASLYGPVAEVGLAATTTWSTIDSLAFQKLKQKKSVGFLRFRSSKPLVLINQRSDHLFFYCEASTEDNLNRYSWKPQKWGFWK